MLNLMKADLYRTRHRLYYFLTIAVPIGLIATVLIFICATIKPSPFQSGEAANFIGMIMQIYPGLAAWMILLMADVTFSEEYRHDTMKNTISYGYSRATYYIAKLLTALLLSVVAVLVMLTATYLMVWPVVGGTAEDFSFIFKNTLLQLINALPLWLGFLSMALAILMNIKNSYASGITYAMILIIPKNVLTILGMLYPVYGTISQFLPSTRLEVVGHMVFSPGGLALNWAIGLGFTLLTTGIGLALFKRKEIK